MEIITKEFIAQIIGENKIELSSTHNKLCLPIINRIFKKMRVGIKFSGIKVENNMICDGHHRYIASLFAHFPLDRISGVITSATTAVNWNSVIFDDEDWDTSAKINMLNEQDAEFNNIPLKELIDILK